MNSLSEELEGIPTWLDLHSVQRDKGSVKEWQEQYHNVSKYGIVTQIQSVQKFRKVFINVVYSSTFKNLSLSQYPAIQNQCSFFRSFLKSPDEKQFHHTTQNGEQFKTYE